MNKPTQNHWIHHFDTDLKELKHLLHSMGDLALQQMQDATMALEMGDIAMAEKVCSLDAAINALDVSVDRAATLMIAKYQPKASDLRLILGLSKMSTDLERIGDQARNIARATQAIVDPAFSEMIAKSGVIGSTEKVLESALDALKDLNDVSAIAVLRADEAVDRACEIGIELTTHFLKDHPDQIDKAFAYLNILKAYERIGDHATNLAEHIIFICDGEDIRHLRLDELPVAEILSGQK